MFELLAEALLIGFVLDCFFGDPYWLPHPICLIGNFIAKGERILRKMFSRGSKGEFAAGMILSLLTVCLSFLVPLGLILLAIYIEPWIEAKTGWQVNMLWLVNTGMCYQILAAKSLKTETEKVYFALEKSDPAGARKALSMIVGRQTAHLDEEQITKAAVETVAENTSDGVIAPMFYFILGGAPLAFAYKAINTLDSMIGYKNDKYLYFGRFAAKLDDAANFIPARITAVLMIAASFVLRYDAKGALRIFKRDRKNHASPNSAQSESVCAGALQIQLAGDAVYFGKLYKKPFIGDKIQKVQPKHIRKAIHLMYGASVIALLLIVAAAKIGGMC
ncbi:MAG: adenosylcobinamide-phosphate synthase CbiB [Emergencia sp.]|nr:adenosylcobinamide-phosphate synthase CbiB [Emergencia sp.]